MSEGRKISLFFSSSEYLILQFIIFWTYGGGEVQFVHLQQIPKKQKKAMHFSLRYMVDLDMRG